MLPYEAVEPHVAAAAHHGIDDGSHDDERGEDAELVWSQQARGDQENRIDGKTGYDRAEQRQKGKPNRHIPTAIPFDGALGDAGRPAANKRRCRICITNDSGRTCSRIIFRHVRSSNRRAPSLKNFR